MLPLVGASPCCSPILPGTLPVGRLLAHDTPNGGDQLAQVVAASEPATIDLLRRLKVELVQDLTHAVVSEVYKQMRGNFLNRLVSFQPPSKSGNLAEYAVFGRMPTLEYVGDDGGPLAATVMADVEAAGPQGAAMGWGPEEQYVSKLSSHAIYVHASDWSKDVSSLTNIGVHSSVKLDRPLAPRFRPVRGPPHDQAAAVHTVTFLMTDGDNIQWLLGPWATDARWFGSPHRGSVPMGWTVSPALIDLAPVVLSHAYGQATPNDSFVSGPSGVGYIYPDKYK